ncbi:hypothetical protein E3T43_09765 [Cryobacterium sp. Hh7]|uniref:hypothetical protein n=1 Tax=Cryobacterium sp. Hh7 TaxID=1259159 RepID=UPI00106B542D|nr:hypothetical protein [Cryobacterium sp. Hh7]TFD56176.1 hypothetical protein E3T43_09765 [Cryobacterium sp. Hh7]
MELLLGVILVAISTALGLAGAARISGQNRGSGNYVNPTVRQKLPMLGWRILHVGLLVFGVQLLHNELGTVAYLMFGIVVVLPLIFALWRNARRPVEA